MRDRIVLDTGPIIALACADALDAIGKLPMELVAPIDVRDELDQGLRHGYASCPWQEKRWGGGEMAREELNGRPARRAAAGIGYSPSRPRAAWFGKGVHSYGTAVGALPTQSWAARLRPAPYGP